MNSLSKAIRLTKKEKAILYLCAGLIAFVVFALIHGLSILNPLYTDWLLLKGDKPQNYIGAQAYRQSAWFFPIGNLNTLRYPDFSSIIFTDSIPLLAVFYKLLGPILPFPFQYIGLWTLLCYVLQAFLAVKILLKYVRHPELVLLGTVFFLVSPVMIFRLFDHWSLGGHWVMLLAALLPLYYEEKYSNLKNVLPLVALLGVLTPGIHIYFCVNCGIIIGFYCLYDLTKQKKILRPVCVMLLYLACALLTTYLLGGFDSEEVAQAGGLGLFSYNLNGLFNSQGYSNIFPGMGMLWGQYEGFAYLGLGIMILLVPAIVYGIIQIREKKASRTLIILSVLFALLCTIAAASNIITFGDTTLVNIPLPGFVRKVWGVFRASGRFIWPLFYLLVFAAVTGTARLLGRRAGALLLAVCLAVQCFDLYPFMSSRFVPGDRVYTSPLEESKWTELVEKEGIEHLVLVGNAENEEALIQIEYDLGNFAILHNLTLNRFRMSHSQFPYMDRVFEAVESFDPGNLFLFLDAAEAEEYSYALDLFPLDGFCAGLAKKQ